MGRCGRMALGSDPLGEGGVGTSLSVLLVFVSAFRAVV